MIGKTEDAVSAETAANSRAPASARHAETAMTRAVVSRLFKVGELTLWCYERLGLIARHRVGDDRVYSWSHCERVTLIQKARSAGLRIRDLRPVIAAMEEHPPRALAETARHQTLTLIHALEDQQEAIGRALMEFYRVEWELSARLGLADSGGADNAAAAR